MGYINHLLHVPWFQFDTGKDLRLLFVLQTVRVFIHKFALFFLPVFLFEIGANWTGKQFYFFGSEITNIQLGMIVVALFYGFLRVATMFTTPYVAVMMHKFGNRLTTTVGYAFFGIAIVALHLATQKMLFLGVASVAFGVFTAFDYITESTILAQNTHKANIGKDLGLSRFLMQMANMVAPMLGGLLIIYAGYQSVFLAGLLLLVVILILSQHLSSQRVVQPVLMTDVVDLFKNRPFQQMMISSFGRYISDAAILIWPVYLFVLLGSVDRVGYLYSASFFLAMLVSMIGGAQVDKSKTNKPFLGTGTTLAGLWIARIFVLNPLTIAFVDALDRLISNYHWIYFEATILKAVKIRKPLTYLVARCVALSFFAVIFWSVVGLLFLILVDGWIGMFVLASIGVLFTLVLRDNMRYDQLDDKEAR
jgi:MFS family permease